MKTGIILIGDLALNGLICQEKDLLFNRFKYISYYLKEKKYVFANIEFPIKTESENLDFMNFFHNSDYEITRRVLKLLNISCVSLANNHIFDLEFKGLNNIISLLDILNIKHTGAGFNFEHIAPVIIEEDNLKIGFISYVDRSTNMKFINTSKLLINYLDINKAIVDIKSIRKMVDIIIFSIHWGKDYSHFYTALQQKIAHELIDMGADIIMGHHPHTIQPYEVYKNKLIFYSLGGLCFGDFFINGELRALKRKTKLGMIAVVNDKGGMEDIIPTKELKGNYIIIPEINIKHKLKRLSFYNRLINKYYIFNLLIKLKETVIDRIYEYFFGYYRNPLKQLVSFSNLKKINFIFRDIKEK